MVHNVLRTEILNIPEFSGTEKKGHLVSHSVRKLYATHTRENGCTKYEKDLHGRWESKGRVLDVYNEIKIPFLDAKVAAKLCIGGPCKYVVRENIRIKNYWILQHVAPKICTRVSDGIAVVLENPLPWFAICKI